MKLRSKIENASGFKVEMESVVGFKPTNNRFAVCLLKSLGYTDIVGRDVRN